MFLFPARPLAVVALFPAVAALPKILCLHGGGQTATAFEQFTVANLQSQLCSQLEFVYASAPESGDLWIRDAPGGKGSGTTDPAWADTSVTYLDNFIATNGPFAGILGYSQGSAFATYYLARKQTAASTPFEFAMLFCGYIPTVHAGLSATIDSAAPFHGIPALVFKGEQDFLITNAMTDAQAAKFTNPTVVSSAATGHNLPATSDATFDTVKNWAVARAGGAQAASSTTSSPRCGNGGASSTTAAANAASTLPFAAAVAFALVGALVQAA